MCPVLLLQTSPALEEATAKYLGLVNTAQYTIKYILYILYVRVLKSVEAKDAGPSRKIDL